MVISTSPLVKTYTLEEFWDLPEPADHSKLELIKGVLGELWLVDGAAKEIDVRSFEAGKTAVYRFPDTLRSEILPKIEIPVATVLS